MRKAIMAAAVLALVTRGLGDTLTMEPARPHAVNQTSVRDAGYVAYDNTVAAPWGAYSAHPGAWLGDDLNLDLGGAPGNILDDISFSIYHGGVGTSGVLSTCDVDIQFYDLSDNSYAGALTFAGLQPGLEPGYFATYHATGLAAQSIALPGDLFIMLRIYNVTGGATKVGQVFCNPPAIGSSSMDFYVDDLNADPPGVHFGWYWFGPNDPANFYFGLGVVPEPTVLAGLVLGCLVLRRCR